MKYLVSNFGPLFGKSFFLYLAAAVSDFYIPRRKMVAHKIQSQKVLDISLTQVPKMLRPLCDEWGRSDTCFHLFTVSFKLETDSNILFSKTESALRGYGVDFVIANQLQNFRDRVNICWLDADKSLKCKSFFLSPDSVSLESQYLEFLIQYHQQYITSGSALPGDSAKGVTPDSSSLPTF